MTRRVRWEQSKVGNVGMALVALGRVREGRGWVDPSLDRPHKRRLPPARGHGQDGSYNFAPGLLAGGAYWRELDDVLATYWARGGGNEFNSPLYSTRVYAAACLSALLGRGGARSTRLLKAWTALLALQAVRVDRQRIREQFEWAGRPTTMRHLTSSGLVIPPTGMRVNHSLGETLVASLLAHVLGVPHTFHKRWSNWRAWSPPATKREAGRTGALPAHGMIGVVANAERLAGRRLRDDPWMRFCRAAALGDLAKWRELADRLKRSGDVALGRGCLRFGIDRGAHRVGTWLEGRLATRQKVSVPAATIERGRTRVLLVAEWKGAGDTPTAASVHDDRVIATADVDGSLRRLVGPAERVVFEQRRWY